MSTSNIKSVLSTPRGTAKDNENSEMMNRQLSTPVMAWFEVELAVDETRSQMQKEAHQKRLKALRKELDTIQLTAWKYEPIEHYIRP